MRLRSHIRPTLMRQRLFKGTLVASLGGLLILLTGMLLPLASLKVVGFPVFAIGLIFIALGLLPYRKLCRLELHPYELQMEAEMLILQRMGRRLVQIPWEVIDALEYVEGEESYGVGVRLKRPFEKRVALFDPRFPYSPESLALLRQGYDLALPYFSARTLEELREEQKSVNLKF